MSKKMVIVITAFIILVFTYPAKAQQAGKVYRIGYFGGSSRINPAFTKGLSELGYVEGKNFIIEFRPRQRIKSNFDIAKELVTLKVDLLLAVGIDATRAAKQATNTIPIVMGNSSADPVEYGLIDSLARPGGNVTGVIDLLPNLAGKRVELLKEIFPELTRIAHLSPAASSVTPPHFKATEAAAQGLGVRVQNVGVRGPNDLERAFQAATDGGAEALIVVGVSFFIPNLTRITKLETKYGLPAMHTHQRWVPSDGLISYTTDSRSRYRNAASYVDKIFKGIKPADLPVQQAAKFLLEINLKTAKTLGISIPRSILLRATDVIE